MESILPGEHDLKGLLDQFQPTEEDRRRARQQALMAASLSLLGRPKGAEYQSFGQAGLLGMGLYNNQLAGIPQQRMESLKTYAALQEMMQKQQAMARRAKFQEGLNNELSGASGVQTAPLAPQGSPQQPMQPTGGIVGQLLQMGVPALQIKLAAASENPEAELQKLATEYNKPAFGAGKIPLVRGPNGSYRAVVPEGFNEALANQATAEKTAEEQAKASFDLIPVPMGNGQTQMMTRADAAKLFAQRPQAPAQQPYSLRGNFTPQELARIQADANGSNPFPVQYGGSVGTTPNPLDMKRAEAAIETGAQKERTGYSAMVENSKNQYEEIRKQFMASRDLDSHVTNMEKLDKNGVFNGPVGEWAGKWANAWNSAFPGSQIEPQKLANSQTFQTEVGKMQQAIARTFPGSQSDRELSALTLSLPTLMTSPQGRAQIYDTLRRKISDSKATYQAASTYYRANDGNLVGFEPPPFTPPPDSYGTSPTQSHGKRFIWNGKQLVPQE